MQDDWTSPSGSRWEPVAPPAGPVAAPVAAPVPARVEGPGPRRRYRRPVVVVLLTVLGAGAVTTGAAYARDGLPAVGTPSPASVAADGTDHHGGPHGHGQHGPRS